MVRAVLLCLLLLSWPAVAVPFRSDRFVVDFPTQPAVTREPRSFRGQAASNGSIYMLIWVANPEGTGVPVQKALDATLTAMVKDAGIQVKTRESLKVDGRPTRQFQGSIHGAPCWGRMTIVGERVYLLLVSGGNPGRSVARFYESFKLL